MPRFDLLDEYSSVYLPVGRSSEVRDHGGVRDRTKRRRLRDRAPRLLPISGCVAGLVVLALVGILFGSPGS